VELLAWSSRPDGALATCTTLDTVAQAPTLT
jgi:hypothetical protein